jgi:ketosteroid isomerase-like protein
VDKDKKAQAGSPSDASRKPAPVARRANSPDPIAAALEAAQRLSTETDAEQAAEDAAQDLAADDFAGNDQAGDDDTTAIVCRACGYHNRVGNKFCSKCGVVVDASAETLAAFAEPRRPRAIALHPNPFLDPEPEAEFRPAPPRPAANRHPEQHAATSNETHHYHHHYHHHYFQGGQEGMGANSGMMPRAGEPAREIDRLRPTAALRGDMSRAEAAVRRISHEWVLACNTKHLDDLLELYSADALILRSNVPPIRGAAAVREFFFGALDSGLGEVEIEPLRIEVVGDMAYEAGRCKALVPSVTGKRREERGKYLWVCARQSGGDWRLAVDCWSSDLMLSVLESDVPAGAVKTNQSRKS